eukprot:5285361-Karenia_brevis.AAC.1
MVYGAASAPPAGDTAFVGAGPKLLIESSVSKNCLQRAPTSSRVVAVTHKWIWLAGLLAELKM